MTVYLNKTPRPDILIQLVENEMVIFAGTIMEAEQENLDNVDLSYKIYNLTLTNNSDYIASVFVDMTFPPGASVTQILMGNRQGQSWYDASLGEFYGIIPVRVENEGITVGKIDDFTGITLNSPAYLFSTCDIPITETPRQSALIPIQRFIT